MKVPYENNEVFVLLKKIMRRPFLSLHGGPNSGISEKSKFVSLPQNTIMLSRLFVATELIEN